ncbi:sensor histidine kinase [Nocardioides rubriscoriae]|uniref:sensor histidine kinase n=1 Tax=Nocardioides rubriscoriae TaxID=642762 RepID=UPI0011DFBD4F|nr:histidine kinase [Nocardioides rubriscoriae]
MLDRRISDPLRVVDAIPLVVYALILPAGLGLGDADVTGREGRARVTGLVVGCLLLMLLEVRWRIRPEGPRTAWGLAVRLVLLTVVALSDTSGLSRAVFVLVPFLAVVAYGVRRGAVVAAGALALVAATLALNPPDYDQAGPLPDVLMLGIGIMLAVTMAAVAHEAEQSRVQIAGLAAAAERARLAREIHDSLGHHLTAISLQLDKATVLGATDRESSDRAVLAARESTRSALRDVRTSVGALRGQLRVPSLGTALHELAQQVRDDRLDVALEIVGTERDLDEATRTTMFRAAQEALTNVRRHSGATRAELVVEFAPAATVLTVRDDGDGFRDGSHDGHGLTGMRERVVEVGGVLEVSSERGRGSTVRVVVTG